MIQFHFFFIFTGHIISRTDGRIERAKRMNLWQKTLDLISKDIKKSVFESWIKSIKPVNEEEDRITLEVGNKFQKDFIESNYSSFIRKALHELTNRDISVLFTISGKQLEPLPFTAFPFRKKKTAKRPVAYIRTFSSKNSHSTTLL